MRRPWLTPACAVLLLGAAAGAQEKLDLKDDSRQASYSVDYQIGADFHKKGMKWIPRPSSSRSPAPSGSSWSRPRSAPTPP
jgi:hypothetical protein